MTEKKSAFPYASVVKSLPFIAFVRTKAADGSFSYDLPDLQGRKLLDFSASDGIEADEDGCLQITQLNDRDKMAQAIRESEEKMQPSTENFCALLNSGKTVWLTGTAVPQKMKNGSVVWKGFWMDVTAERKKEYFNSLALDSVNEGVAAFDKQGKILSFSQSLMNMLGCTHKDVSEKTIFSLLPQDVAETMQQYMLLSALKEKVSITVDLPHADGSVAFVEIDMMQRDAIFVCLFRDITDYREREEDLRYLAYHDLNTGVENFTYLVDVFKSELDQAKVSQTQIAVLSIAPDSFGQLNAVSEQGVKARLIAGIADRIRSCLSDTDHLAQTSAQRFTALIPGLEFTLEVEKKIENILKGFERPIYIDELEFDLTVSIGVCFCPQDGEELGSLIARADLALEQRTDEKSAMRIYNSDLSMKAAINLNMRSNLKKAIEKGEINAYFQPQVDIKTGRIVGLEALARWRTDDGILIPPAEFIPEAEEYGMIDSLTQSMLEQACQWNQKWYSMGLCRVPVAVNISGRQFHNETQLLCSVDKALDDSGLPPYLLELELTESSAMYDPKNAQRIIQTLLDNNIRCALDDFGTGYSSLSVLRSFPLKKIKIDRSFILELSEKKNTEIVRATIVMAHALNLSVLAEGVENRQHFDILRDLGCDIIQGYLFSRPLSPEQTELMLMRWDADIASNGSGF